MLWPDPLRSGTIWLGRRILIRIQSGSDLFYLIPVSVQFSNSSLIIYWYCRTYLHSKTLQGLLLQPDNIRFTYCSVICYLLTEPSFGLLLKFSWDNCTFCRCFCCLKCDGFHFDSHLTSAMESIKVT